MRYLGYLHSMTECHVTEIFWCFFTDRKFVKSGENITSQQINCFYENMIVKFMTASFLLLC